MDKKYNYEIKENNYASVRTPCVEYCQGQDSQPVAKGDLLGYNTNHGGYKMSDDAVDEKFISDMTQVMPKLSHDEIKTIPIVCPWCNKIYKVTKWQVSRDKRTGVSHGICPQCYQKMKKNGRL
ncbi:MAG TPA: hypothetical protein DET40_25775 [Lentisphaeria bacterium]|nr:MAG: hypothetical protein A2X45_14865 [Lentisphaerae bacterium GWF2_50_93]HCE46971.1 hypothetical protein [Lentisphaeria bacterium]